MVEPSTKTLVACEYNEQYYRRTKFSGTVGYGDYLGAEYALRSTIADTFSTRIKTEFPEAKKYLDIGCGGGYLVKALAATGDLDVVGVDPAPYPIKNGVLEGHGQLLVGDTQSDSLHQLAPFDVITMMDVIEHLHNPIQSLRAARHLLQSAGSLVILTPRYGGALTRIQGAEYIHLNSDHSLYFTVETLSLAVQKATGQTPRITGVLEWLTEGKFPLPDAVRDKYTRERDSIVATLTLS